MSNDTTNYIGNGSSIFKTIGLMFAGYIISTAVSHGVNLHGQETQITEMLGIVLGFALSYIDMKYANSYFKKNITLEDYIKYGEKHFFLQEVENTCQCDECGCEKSVGDDDAA